MPDQSDPPESRATIYPDAPFVHVRVELTLTPEGAIATFVEAPSDVLGSLFAPLRDDGIELVDSGGARWARLLVETTGQRPGALECEAYASLGTALEVHGRAERIALRRAAIRILAALAQLGGA